MIYNNDAQPATACGLWIFHDPPVYSRKYKISKQNSHKCKTMCKNILKRHTINVSIFDFFSSV